MVKSFSHLSNTLCCYPLRTPGVITGYVDDGIDMPGKILDMGLLPDTPFIILYQAPFCGPLYIEFGQDRTRIALREEEARYIIVAPMPSSYAS